MIQDYILCVSPNYELKTASVIIPLKRSDLSLIANVFNMKDMFVTSRLAVDTKEINDYVNSIYADETNKEYIYEEIFQLTYYGQWSFREAFNLPVLIRKWFINRIAAEKTKEYESRSGSKRR